jgi:hypothetical protein
VGAVPPSLGFHLDPLRRPKVQALGGGRCPHHRGFTLALDIAVNMLLISLIQGCEDQIIEFESFKGVSAGTIN